MFSRSTSDIIQNGWSHSPSVGAERVTNGRRDIMADCLALSLPIGCQSNVNARIAF